MTTRQFSLFETTIGRCALAWGDAGIVLIQLPEGSESRTRARILARIPDARSAPPPPSVKDAIESIQALLRGEAPALDSIRLDMQGVPPFHRRVYDLARTIPPGETLSYGEIATRLGAPGSARAVGQALGKNPFAIVVPCHRVLAAGGRVGGFSASGGVATKLRMLSIEGARTGKQSELFDGDGAFGFHPAAAVEHLRGSDPKLCRLIETVGPFRMELKQTPSIFAALMEAIVYQQLTGKAAATIHSRLCALFPRSHGGPSADQILRAPEELLRSAGLSRSKALSLKDLAAKSKAGRVPSLAEAHRMTDDALIERLTEVRGIGRWTVEMLLMFRLGRADVLPVDDYGVRKGFAEVFHLSDLPNKVDMEKRGARWKPYRSVASWYLWRAAERAPRRESPARKKPPAKGSKGSTTKKKLTKRAAA